MSTTNMPTSAAVPLVYTFTPSQYPLLASTPGVAQSQVDLQVMISNPNLDPAVVVLQEIRITIPVGEDSQRSLSTDQTLPAPSGVSATGGWTVSNGVQGGVLRITASQPTTAAAEPIVFTLKGLKIPTTPGTALIPISEYATSGGPAMDHPGCYVTKLPDDFPLLSFTADPSSLSAPGSVILHWTAKPGDTSTYQLSCADLNWLPKDCNKLGICYSATDGAAGVATPATDQTRTYQLDRVVTLQAGARAIAGTLLVTVSGKPPAIASQSHVGETYLGGSLVMLHWFADNATTCELYLDASKEPFLKDLPTNTFQSGYLVVLPMPGMHILTLGARYNGGQPALFPFQEISTAAPTAIAVASPAYRLAFTPDSKMAMAIFNNQLATILLTGSTPVRGNTVTLPSDFHNMFYSCASNGTTVVTYRRERVQGDFWNAATLQHVASAPFRGLVTSVAATPDMQYALIGRQVYEAYLSVAPLMLMDLTKHTFVEPPKWANWAPPDNYDNFVADIAVLGNGTFALCLDSLGVVWFFDLSTHAATPVPLHITVADINHFSFVLQNRIRLTPDNKLAVITSSLAGQIHLFDVAARKLRASIVLLAAPLGVAVEPTSRFAVVSTAGGSLLVDLQTQSVLPQFLPWGTANVDSSPNGNFLLATNANSNDVSVFDMRASTARKEMEVA